MANPALKVASALVGFCAVLGAGGSVGAQPAAGIDDDVRFSGARPTAGYETVHALDGDWQRVQIFAAPNLGVRLPDGRPWIEFAARRVSGERDESGAITWTSSRTCPALRNTLVWLTTLVAPRIEIGGITPSEADPEGRRPISIVADGLVTTVWGRGTQPDYTAFTRVEISRNGGLIAEFGRAASANLEPCWHSQEPTF